MRCWRISQHLFSTTRTERSVVTLITDRGLAFVCKIRSLESLEVCGNITDSGLDALVTLPNLKELTLWGGRGRLTENALLRLDNLRQLKKLDLGSSGIPEDAVKRFHEAHPSIELLDFP